MRTAGARARSATAAPSKAVQRLALAALGFGGLMAWLSVEMADLAATSADALMTDDFAEGIEAAGVETADVGARGPAVSGGPPRAPIVDRRGAPLAHSLRAYDLYLDASQLPFVDERLEAARRLAALFPGLDAAALGARFVRGGTARAHERPITPIEAQLAHDLGVPGLYHRPRMERVYHSGSAAAHLVGYVDGDGRGRAGVEGALDARLRASPDEPLRLSVDLRLQLLAHQRLREAMAATSAEAGAAIVLHVRTGEIFAHVSAPDFDPHDPAGADRSGAPFFDRAAASAVELGSVLKIFTWALALESGDARFGDVFDASAPVDVGGGRSIDDGRDLGRITFETAFARSSNNVAAALALAAGRGRLGDFYERLGLTEPTGVELSGARDVDADFAEPWGRSETARMGFGYSVGVTPLHLAAAVASLVNGGERVRPTVLLRDAPAPAGERVVSPETSRRVRDLMRIAVSDGTGEAVDAPGLDVGGKTGTAELLDADGSYRDDATRATFAAVFPASAPEFVVVTTLEGPEILRDGRIVRSASATAAPFARAVIEDVAGVLGVRLRLAAEE